MTEGKQDHVYTESLKALQKRMQLMFNNEKHSDTVFTVKQHKFYAISEIVSVASSKLDTVISEHFAHCDDKKIKLYDVKCEKSFSVILQYMYGLDINFSELTMHVLCGVITLAETYQLDEFVKDLKSYLSKVDKFEMNSLVVLLNTARKYNLEELYGKLKVFAYEHAEEFVKHDTIVQLQYECILNLIKSDWFCAPEIDILKGVLNWHTFMNTKEKRESLEHDDEDDAEVEDSSDDRCSVASDQTCDGDDVEMEDINNDRCSEASDQMCDGDDATRSKRQKREHVESTDVEVLEHNANEQNLDSEATTVADQKDKCSEFSENVLKSLLLHVRVKKISMFHFIELCETDEKYEQMLGDKKLFSQTNDARQKCVHIVSQNGNDKLSVTESVSVPVATMTEIVSVPVANIGCSNVLLQLNDYKKRFLIKMPSLSYTEYKSEDSYKSNDFTWAISFEDTRIICNTIDQEVVYFRKVYLECTSDKECDWECTTECQLTMLSSDKNLSPDQVLPSKAVHFRKDNPCQYLGEFYRDTEICKNRHLYKRYDNVNKNYYFEFEVLFKSIRASVKT
uniref:BTB/POZ domain-containing protein 9 n=1 Tax=Cacopsylla melanoneura TaxID=428564 RepID=A0A8D9ANK7_9HEMI